MLTLSFHELVPGCPGVRMTENKRIWAVDLTMMVTGKNRNDANECLRDLKQEIFNKENFIIESLKENGGKNTRLVTFEHACPTSTRRLTAKARCGT